MSWFISDNHFNHKNIIKYCNRPFSSVEQMNGHMIQCWNNTVQKDDEVFHLGDFGLGRREDLAKIFEQLNGNITLIRGNHDRLSTKAFKEIGFKDVFKRLELGKFVLSHRPLPLEELKENQINLHGHIHNNKTVESSTPQHLNLSCEVISYTPLWVDVTI